MHGLELAGVRTARVTYPSHLEYYNDSVLIYFIAGL